MVLRVKDEAIQRGLQVFTAGQLTDALRHRLLIANAHLEAALRRECGQLNPCRTVTQQVQVIGAPARVRRGLCLQALAQEEQMNQVAGGAAGQQASKGVDLAVQHQVRLAAVAAPEVDECAGRRVVRGVHQRVGAALQANGGQASYPVQPVGAGAQVAALQCQATLDGVVDQLGQGMFRCHAVQQSGLRRRIGLEWLAAEHHAHGQQRVDQIRQARGGAQPRMQADQYLRQAQPGIRCGQAHVAAQREFQAAAKGVAVHDGQRRAGQINQLLGQQVSVHQLAHRVGFVVDSGKIVQVGAQAKAACLGRAQDQRARHFPAQAGQHVAQFTQRGAAEQVGRLPLLIEQQPGDLAVVAAQAPVLPWALVRLLQVLLAEGAVAALALHQVVERVHHACTSSARVSSQAWA